MKILITGGCGFVGSNLAIYFKDNHIGTQINSLDNLSIKGTLLNFNRLKKKKIKNFKIDISNNKAVQNLPRYDLVIDCCAEASVVRRGRAMTVETARPARCIRRAGKTVLISGMLESLSNSCMINYKIGRSGGCLQRRVEGRLFPGSQTLQLTHRCKIPVASPFLIAFQSVRKTTSRRVA